MNQLPGNKKIITFILLITLIVPPFFFVAPQKAEANIPVIDFTNTGREFMDVIG